MKSTFLIITFALTLIYVEAARCPLVNILPCDCTSPVLPPVTPPTLRCGQNGNFTQADINEAIRAYRVANGALVPTNKIELYYFTLYGPFLDPILDLTKLAHMNFGTFELSSTGQKIVGGTNSTDEIDIAPFRFSAEQLITSYGELNDEKTAELLKFVEPKNLTSLWLWYNDLTVVPDLTPFTELTAVLLARTKITKLSGGQFRTLGRLDTIALDNMAIGEIGENGLLIERPFFENGTMDVPCGFQYYPRPCEIRLHFNNLTESKIHLQNGFESWGGPTDLSLDANHIEFLSAEKFEKYLQAHPQNILSMSENPLICDVRMKWLKDKREEYEPRMFGMDCANDPGQTVFTSSLIP